MSVILGYSVGVLSARIGLFVERGRVATVGFTRPDSRHVRVWYLSSIYKSFAKLGFA